ncbi:MAG: FAD-dependent oxidoreductase [Chloroflexota bacterium]
MAKPVLLAVDDEPEVLRAVERDLRQKYGADYRIMRAGSGNSALDTLKQLKLRGEPLALLLVDQRMPGMTGIEFLEHAIEIYPDAKRVLLTAYADTDAAIQAINSIRIHHYLLKPWHPPEERLYPVLSDLLDDWEASFHPPFEGLRLVGERWSSDAFYLKEFLTSNQVPYQWLEASSSDEAQRLLATSGASRLPVVFFPDGTVLEAPAIADLATRVGLRRHPERPFYDFIIVGGGPAGLAAAVYGASEGLRTLVVEERAPGGQAGASARIENYLGFPSGISGADLAHRAVAQSRRFGVEILTPQQAVKLRTDGQYRVLTLADGTEMSSYTLLVSSGVSYRRLEAPGADGLVGSGVYYGGALCEALSVQGEDVFIVGGANSAGQAAVHFAKFARNVTMLVRGDNLDKGMSRYLIDRIRALPNVKVALNTEVAQVQGNGRLESLTLSHTDSGQLETLPAAAMFTFIGASPHTAWLEGVVARDRLGFILTGPDLMTEGHRPRGWAPDRDPFLLETNVPGVFAAGDVRGGSVKRVATAVGEGSMAVQFVHRYLAEVGE